MKALLCPQEVQWCLRGWQADMGVRLPSQTETFLKSDPPSPAWGSFSVVYPDPFHLPHGLVHAANGRSSQFVHLEGNPTMYTKIPQSYALAAADQMVSNRFSADYAISTLSEYFLHLDNVSTAHLADHHAARLNHISGKQRRTSIIHFGECGGLLTKVPINDPRTNETVLATINFPIWLDLMELGACGSWVLNYKSLTQRAPQVRTSVPFRGKSGPNLATITRLIVNAKSGQQARLKDGNPLNLRRENIYIVGNPNTAGGRKGRAKTDTRMALRQAVDLRKAKGGAGYDYERGNDQ